MKRAYNNREWNARYATNAWNVRNLRNLSYFAHGFAFWQVFVICRCGNVIFYLFASAKGWECSTVLAREGRFVAVNPLAFSGDDCCFEVSPEPDGVWDFNIDFGG